MKTPTPSRTPTPGTRLRGHGPILLTGATGYIGGRLLAALEQQGVPVRCLARSPERLRTRVAASTSVVEGDVLDGGSLDRALDGIQTAYYLVHSMGSSGDFEEEDRRAARLFAAAAARSGVRRIVYLGGLGSGPDLSRHLQSRQEVGHILRASRVQTIELRASIVIGSGSVSFEMVRALTEKLPFMITPRWIRTPTQPIAVDDLIAYLDEARRLRVHGSRVYEVGGADRVSYGDIIREYARQRGLARIMVPVPLLTPRLSSYWLGLVTPVYARIGRKLLDGVRNPTFVEDDAARTAFPTIRPRGIRAAIASALATEDCDFAKSRWSDALSSSGREPRPTGARFGSRIVDSRVVEVTVPPATAFAPIRRLGGRVGWYYGNWLWRLRGFLDLLVGGVGVRRGRRHPERLHVGDTVDFWRVAAIEPDRRLRLAAEMRLPGRAWLEFEVEPTATGARIRQTAEFDPVGWLGLLYWYALYPVHRHVFAGMLAGIARSAQGRPRYDHPPATPRGETYSSQPTYSEP